MKPTTQSEMDEASKRINPDVQMLADINTLKGNEAFNRYWLGKLRRRRAEVEVEFRTGRPEVVTPARREELRQVLLLLDEQLDWMRRDEGAIQAAHIK